MSTNARDKRLRTENGGLSPPPMKRKQQASINQKAVSNFFKPTSQKEKEPEKVSWRTIEDSLLIGKYQTSETTSDMVKTPGKRKIAGFDFDSTLITTQSGLRYGRDAMDWKWWDGSIPSKLRSLHEDGYVLVVLSNQAGVSFTPPGKRLTDLKRKATAVFTQLDLPLTLYAATAHDKYRKPRPGMWERLLLDSGLKVEEVDLESSIFVGDAGGRVESGKLRKDFSISDRNFAHNVGIAFKTPEEFFLGEESRQYLRDFDPAQYFSALAAPTSVTNDSTAPTTFTKKHDLDIVLFCGSPGAGKSTFYWNVLKPVGYERVNQDTLKSRDRCLKVAAEFIQEKKSVVVDNTNAEPKTREVWIKLARKLNVPIRCVLFTASSSLCMHNDAVRALNAEIMGLNPEKREMLPKMAFTSFASRYREPDIKEGFEDITKVDFIFQGTDEQRIVWSKFWT